MKKFNKLGEASAPDGSIVALYEHDGAHVIHVNGRELMSTRRHESEEQLAELICAPLQHAVAPRVLIGGLGLGFTLRTALRILPSDASVVVAEIIPEVVAWNRNEAYGLAHVQLQDARVEVKELDVARVIDDHPASFDGIMLDVDNGADAMTTSGNADLYRLAGIAAAAAALRPHGRIAYWSAEADPSFEKMLRRAGLSVAVTKARSYALSAAWHRLIVAERAGPA